MSIHHKPTLEYAQSLDQQDPLKNLRDEFFIPKIQKEQEVHYFCGHSLGLQPKCVSNYVNEFLDDWKNFGVEGHFHGNHPWYPYHEFLQNPMANIVGALPQETIIMNSLSMNIHSMLSTFWHPRINSGKSKILLESLAFPSDIYAVHSHIYQRGLNPHNHMALIDPPEGEALYPKDYILNYIEEHHQELAMIFLGGVQFKTGQYFPLKEITEVAKNFDIIVGFDLAHAVGNIDLELHDWNVDFAVWCTYKYLNSGAGNLGGAYIHEKWVGQKNLPRLGGWWGHDKDQRFKLSKQFTPMETIEGWQVSNPSIISMAAIRASLSVFTKAQGMTPLREKSKQLTGYLEFLLRELPGPAISLVTGTNPDERGCQLSIKISSSQKAIIEQLKNKGFIFDFREPDIIRLAPTPLYNTFNDVYQFAKALKS